MARITARQAYTRARTKRMATRADVKALMQKKANLQRANLQKASSIIESAGNEATRLAADKKKENRAAQAARENLKKITDYFGSSKNPLDIKPQVKAPLKTSISLESGVEVITLIEEVEDDNNNNQNEPPQDNVDGDIEIVEILPPIPLRDHPVHEIDC